MDLYVFLISVCVSCAFNAYSSITAYKTVTIVIFFLLLPFISNLIKSIHKQSPNNLRQQYNNNKQIHKIEGKSRPIHNILTLRVFLISHCIIVSSKQISSHPTIILKIYVLRKKWNNNSYLER